MGALGATGAGAEVAGLGIAGTGLAGMVGDSMGRDAIAGGTADGVGVEAGGEPWGRLSSLTKSSMLACGADGLGLVGSAMTIVNYLRRFGRSPDTLSSGLLPLVYHTQNIFYTQSQISNFKNEQTRPELEARLSRNLTN